MTDALTTEFSTALIEGAQQLGGLDELARLLAVPRRDLLSWMLGKGVLPETLQSRIRRRLEDEILARVARAKAGLNENQNDAENGAN